MDTALLCPWRGDITRPVAQARTWRDRGRQTGSKGEMAGARRIPGGRSPKPSPGGANEEQAMACSLQLSTGCACMPQNGGVGPSASSCTNQSTPASRASRSATCLSSPTSQGFRPTRGSQRVDSARDPKHAPPAWAPKTGRGWGYKASMPPRSVSPHASSYALYL